MNLSIILPAKNEEQSIGKILDELNELYPDAEIIVVNDASTDDTRAISEAKGAIVISHPYSKGNGAAIKSGVKAASGDVLVLMDADGQHKPEFIPQMLEKLDSGFDMVVGARSRSSQAGKRRFAANTMYNKLASWIVSRQVDDLTSGFRAVNAAKFKEFLYMYPNGFSYPTTSTMAFFRSGYAVGYVPINTGIRNGSSHINLTKDGIRFLLIIFRIGTLYSPLKVFFPMSAVLFITGIVYYSYTYFNDGRFTNMSALLFICSILIFAIGLISEQITMLLFKHDDHSS